MGRLLRGRFTGVALPPASGDKDYPQSPLEEVTTLQNVARWNALRYRPVDCAALREDDDGTEVRLTAACAAGRRERRPQRTTPPRRRPGRVFKADGWIPGRYR